MPPDTAAPARAEAGRLATFWAGFTPEWRAALVPLAAAWLAQIVLFGSDWLAMADQWWNSSTYNHVLLIPAILGWLVWQRAPELAWIVPRTWWPALILAVGAAFVWVLGAFAGLNLARQLGAVGLLIAATVTLLGPRASAGLAFPLAYLLLLVPFGDELVPLLQMITADITVALVHLSGVPAVIDGVFISTPAGLFEVAEACSGVKFLIAMIAFGLLVANVGYLGWRRRALFMLACLVVPILANGVRAWGTIFAAQHFGIEAAAGFDHIVYGWVFFAIVIALILALAWRTFDRPADGAPIDPEAINASLLLGRLETMTIGLAAALAALALIPLAAKAWATAADRLEAPLPARIDLPPVPGWTRVDYIPQVWWQPRASGAAHRLLGRYRDAQGSEVDVFVALYAGQGEGREAGGFGQGALMPQSAWNWQSPGPDLLGGKSDRLLADGRVHRLAVTWYRTGQLVTGSNTQLKLAAMADRLLLRERPTTMLILSAEDRPGHSAERSIRAFAHSTGALDAWMDRAGGIR
jgi:exosortase A